MTSSSHIVGAIIAGFIAGGASGYFVATQMTKPGGTAAISTSAGSSDLSAQIKDYISNNPKDIIESLQQWQVREETSRVRDQAKAVQDIASHFKDDHHYGVAGNPKGDVTIVEFFDYNCPACKMMFESLDSLLKEDKNVRILFVEFPIFGPMSDMNARIATAVATMAPEKYYDFHSALMREKGKINADQAYQVAGTLGIDVEKLKAEVAKPESATYLNKDRQLGQQLKIQGTPAAIIGTQMVNSALSLNDLKTQLRWARTTKQPGDKAAPAPAEPPTDGVQPDAEQ